ncbi:MAG TPA: hypothetical protein GXZ52_01390 [Clostridiales bacterium]|nr:hypothetical protein [Clostridiales bacterium]
MKTKIRIGLSCFLIVAAIVSAISALALESKESIKNQNFTVSESHEEDTGAKEGFILKEYEGYIGIFSPGFEKIPITVTDIEVSTLREADKELLAAGIYTSSREEMMQLLEDFGS